MGILEKIKSKMAGKSENPDMKEIRKFMSTINMTFNGYGGLSVHGLVVSEFGYLIRYLTNKKIDSLSDFRIIAQHKALIDKSIQAELSKSVLRESEVFGYSREITEGNILRLQKIVNSICGYTKLCDTLGVDTYAARDS